MLVEETDNKNMTDLSEFLLPGLTNTPFDFDIECSLSPNGDALHQLMDDLEIPMLMDDDEGNGSTPSETSTPSPMNGELWRGSPKLENHCSVDYWGSDIPANILNCPSDWTDVKKEIKVEDTVIVSLPPSPSTGNSSDSGDSGVHCWLNSTHVHKQKSSQQKLASDSPPLSPPTRDVIPSSPSPTTANNVSPPITPLVMVSPVNLIPIKPSATTVSTVNGHNNLIFTANNQQAKRIKIQPRPIKLETLDSTASVPLVPRIKVVPKQDLISSNPSVWTASSLLPTTDNVVSSDLKVPIPALNTARSCPSVTLGPQQNPIELKLLKKHQRMIKNRESACQSRRKKKEYVSALEQQLENLRQEIQQLTQENQMLKERLSKVEGKPSINRAGNKPSKGAVTALFAIILFTSLNMGPLSGMLRGRGLVSSSLENSHHEPEMPPLAPGSGPGRPYVGGGRSLLWATSVMPDLKILNGSILGNSMPTCPVPINQTESRRLDSELRGWFEEEQGHRRHSRMENVTAVTEIAPQPSLFVPLTPAVTPPPLRYKLKRKRPLRRRKLVEPGAEVVLYNGPQRYAALMDAIRRRDDTFYVVSLSGDHLLLPARAHNHTLRPKVSLVMPTAANGSVPRNHIAMMQIDCEVTDTRLIHVDESFLPAKFRNNATDEPTTKPTPSPTPTESTATPKSNPYDALELYKTHKALFNHAKDFP